jgi:hypothetical protein
VRVLALAAICLMGLGLVLLVGDSGCGSALQVAMTNSPNWEFVPRDANWVTDRSERCFGSARMQVVLGVSAIAAGGGALTWIARRQRHRTS